MVPPLGDAGPSRSALNPTVDLASKSLDRLPIYARLGVPEIWCYDSGILTIYRLSDGSYIASDQSQVFPMLNIRSLPQLIES
jgi:Uma2 family endonuclease